METISISGGSRPGVWGGSQIGGRQNVFTCLNTKRYLRQSLCVTQKRLSFVGQKVAILLVKLCYFSGNNHSLKALYIIKFRKRLKRVPNSGPRFSQATQISYIYKNLFKRYKSMLRASVCHCFWLSITKSVKNSVWNAFSTWLETERLFLDLEVTTQVPR